MVKKIKKITKAILAKKEKRKQRKENKEKFNEWREQVLIRDNNADQLSGKQTGGHLHVHHILDKKNFPQFRFEVMNGITLNYWNHKVGNLSPHLNAVYFSLWLQKNKPEQYEWAINKLKELKLL